MWKKIQDDALIIPEPTPLRRHEKVTPYVILGNEAFALHETKMKENVFGILTAVFRVLWKSMQATPLTSRSCVAPAAGALQDTAWARPSTRKAHL